ncbi:MAG: hypothetical protein LUI14_10845 [Lachnospiraceae bacterium]|nr:hypothetical protein [Lachnospiraceae bacterium]
MATHYAREGFYQKLLHTAPPDEYTPEAIKKPPEEIKNLIGDSLEIAEASGLYELCQKYSDISLNSKKFRVEGTCDVGAYFRPADIEAAKIATKVYVKRNGITDIQGLMAVIKEMHRHAVDDDKTGTTAFVAPENNGGTIFGMYYSFRGLPEDFWGKLEKEVITYIEET